MKKLSIVLLLLILLVGCGGNAAPPESSAPASLADLPEEGLVMAMERPIYDPSVTSCIYFIRNGTQETVEFGEPYRLQYWKNGGWQDPQEDACFTAIGYCLPPGETKALSCWLGENQEPGNYRLVKEVDGEPLPINGTQGFTGATRAFTGELPNPRKPPDNLISWSLDKGREKNLLFCTWVVPRRSFNS